MSGCMACPRQCGASRETGALGRCGAPALFQVARAALHFWEEPCISGAEGSGTVFFSGCSLGCAFCQNIKISQEGFGAVISDRRLMEIFDELIAQGAWNINLVNPTHYAPRLARVLREYQCPVPVVYNSSGYERVETLRELEGLVDIYLPDLKYISGEKSARYSGAPDYFTFASAAVLEMQRQVGENRFDQAGRMTHGLMIRHLILPGNTKESIRVLQWIKKHLPGEVLVSLMSQYFPCGRASRFPEINRRITRREYDKVVEALLDLGLDQGFLQELSSAGEEYIPPFDLTGVLQKGCL